MSIYNNHGYAIARCAIDKLAATVRLALGAFAYAPKLNKPKKFNYFDTYELALEDALKYALENLV